MSKSICIIGAGPGGSIAALTLAEKNIPCTVIDKATFPREKVCGDGFSGWVKVIFDRINPEYTKELLDLPEIRTSSGAKIFVPNGKHVEFNLPPDKMTKKGFTLRREVFDNFLVEKLRKHPLITFRENYEVSDLERTQIGYLIKNKNENQNLNCDLVIIANGAFSKFAKKISGIRVSPKQNMVCTRTYYRGVTGISEDNPQLEFYFLNSTLPGYLWFFPETDDITNIGVGYFASDMKKKKLNPKHVLPEIIENEPLLKDRFKSATQVDSIKSCGLPLGHKKHKLALDHAMIIGDAAVLANPLTGEGISAAMFSGSIAANHAIKCWEKKDFSRNMTLGYQKELYRRLWWEISISQKLQKLVAKTWIMNLLGNKYDRSKTFRDILHASIENLKPMRKIFNPYYLIKIFLNK